MQDSAMIGTASLPHSSRRRAHFLPRDSGMAGTASLPHILKETTSRTAGTSLVIVISSPCLKQIDAGPDPTLHGTSGAATSVRVACRILSGYRGP
jgi:hypothetical protein